MQNTIKSIIPQLNYKIIENKTAKINWIISLSSKRTIEYKFMYWITIYSIEKYSFKSRHYRFKVKNYYAPYELQFLYVWINYIYYLYQIVIRLIFEGLIDYFSRGIIFGIGVAIESLGLWLIQWSNSVVFMYLLKRLLQQNFVLWVYLRMST